MYFDFSALYLVIYFSGAFLALLLTAHFGWLITLWLTRLGNPVATIQGRAWLIVAALTPLISFYALRLADWARGDAPQKPPTEWWRRLMIPLAFLLLAATAWQYNQQYAPEYRSLGGILTQLRPLTTYLIIISAIVHMAASVFALTQRSLLTSRIPPAVAGFFLLLP